MPALLAAVRFLRGRLHERAYDEARRPGHRDTAHVLWVLVDELDHLINHLTPRKGQPAMSEQPWPNQAPVVDGVTPLAQVPQNPDLFDADDDDLDQEME